MGHPVLLPNQSSSGHGETQINKATQSVTQRMVAGTLTINTGSSSQSIERAAPIKRNHAAPPRLTRLL